MLGSEFEYSSAVLGNQITMFLRMYLDTDTFRLFEHLLGLLIRLWLSWVNNHPLQQSIDFSHNLSGIHIARYRVST